jgi:hypothetical protein
MAKFVFTYTGGSGPGDMSPERVQEVMAAWEAWYGEMGAAVVDGGAPFGRSVTIAPDGSTSEGGGSGLTGYTIISAESLELATKLASGSPHLTDGGTVEVYEAIDMQ